MSLREKYNELAKKYGWLHPSGEYIADFSDKGSVHTYMDFYDKFMITKFNDIKLLEIGILTGGSIHLWQQYFDNYYIAGVDLATGWYKGKVLPYHSKIINDKNIELYFGYDSRRSVPKELLNKQFDFIIDDANHGIHAQVATLENYWPLLCIGGTYFVEDLHDINKVKIINKVLNNLDSKFVTEVYEGRIDSRRDDRILAITKL